MGKTPLAEVFGFPISNISIDAERFRNNRLCPFHNKVPSCTKNSAIDPLGACSINHNNKPVITCPIRFTENWQITEEAAKFFFNKDVIKKASWTSLREVRLEDINGKMAGNIDYVLVAYDGDGNVLDFGSLEIQAVYISGNVTKPFKYYMANRSKRKSFDWSNHKDFPRPDYLSSSRKRLAPQLIYKGGILKAWAKKQAVVMQKSFYDTIPELPAVKNASKADMAWLIYDLKTDKKTKALKLQIVKTIYTEFKPALDEILLSKAGRVEDFISGLQKKLDKELSEIEPEAPTLMDLNSK